MIRGKMKTLFIVAATVLCLSACTNVIGGSDAQEDDRESQTVQENDGKDKKKDEKGKKEDKKEKDVNEVREAAMEHAEELMELLRDKLGSEEYFKLTLTSHYMENETYQKLKEMDYGQAKYVYEVEFPEDFMELYVESAQGDAGFQWDAASENLRKALENQVFHNYATILISTTYQSEQVVMNSILASTDYFVEQRLAGERKMLLFVYENAYPVLFTFNGKPDGAVWEVANVIFFDDFQGESEEEVQKAMQKPFEKFVEFKGGFKVERIR